MPEVRGQNETAEHASLRAAKGERKKTKAKEKKLSKAQQLDERSIKLKEPMNATLVSRICEALIESDFTPNGVRHLLRESRA